MNKLFLSRLGLCRKAGALAVGTGAVTDAVRRKQAKLVFCASDLSEKSRKKFMTLCAHYGVRAENSSCTMAEFSDAVGKEHSVAAVAITKTDFLHLF